MTTLLAHRDICMQQTILADNGISANHDIRLQAGPPADFCPCTDDTTGRDGHIFTNYRVMMHMRSGHDSLANMGKHLEIGQDFCEGQIRVVCQKQRDLHRSVQRGVNNHRCRLATSKFPLVFGVCQKRDMIRTGKIERRNPGNRNRGVARDGPPYQFCQFCQGGFPPALSMHVDFPIFQRP